jgi:hypothetical protein
VFPLFFFFLGSGLPTRKHNGGYPWFIPIVNSDGDLFLVACLFLQGITYTQAVEIFLKTVAKKYVFLKKNHIVISAKACLRRARHIGRLSEGNQSLFT